MTRRVAALALVVGALTTGCVAHPVGPARTDAAYEGKAVTTAEAALSSVQTARLVATAASKGNAFGAYTGVVLSEQEEGLSTVQGTFDSIQPPSRASDRLRDELGDLLRSSLDHVAAVRIAARRGRLADLSRIAAPLRADAAALERFTEDHG